MPTFFAQQLLRWHALNPRLLPWTGGPRDPYHIWISEIIMQQTRIEQGAKYYHRFISAYPTVDALAAAPIDDVLFLWEGLGYYTRARNLHKAANYIVTHYQGEFPRTYEDLLTLPGIGPYSAAAIASFAYGLPYPVVDGNVKRLVSRFGGITLPIDSPAAHELIRQQATLFIKGTSPAEFNQAIMNFGALVCKPKAPLCPACPLKRKCIAFQSEQVSVLPVKSKSKRNRIRYFHFLVLHYRKTILFERRDEKDIWNGLFILPYLETNSIRKPVEAFFVDKIHSETGHHHFHFHHSSGNLTQVLSHQTIAGRFHHFILEQKPKRISSNQIWANRIVIDQVAKPKMMVDWLKENEFLISEPSKRNSIRSSSR